MAETEPNLPMDLPIPRPSWGQRIKAAFTHPIKLPGWLAVLIVVAQEIPDWKHRIDFWLEVAKGTGGYLAMAAAAIASPYFTPSLLVAGLGWIIFAGEAHKGVQRHHWLRYVGWSIVTTCLTLMVITVGYGALTFYIQQQVSQKDTELQNKYAQAPIYWHLTDAQRTALPIALDRVSKDKRFKIDIQCLPNSGSRTFVEEFAVILHDHDWQFSANCLFSRLKPGFTGVSVGVTPSLKDKIVAKRNMDEWNDGQLPDLKALITILSDAQIPAIWSIFDDDSKQDRFYLLIGNAPKDTQ